MKKTIAFLLIALLTLSFSTALADSAPKSKEDQMVGLVKGFLEENEFPYEYDDYTFTVPFAVENSMEYVYMTVYIYDDMLAVSADAPVQGTGDVFEKMAVFAALANNEIYYAQFRVELDADKVYVSCRSCNLVEDVIPGETNCFTCSPCRRAIWRTTATASWRCSTAAIPTRRLKPVRRRWMRNDEQHESISDCKGLRQKKNGSPRCAGLRHLRGSDRILDGQDVFAGENAGRRDGYSHIRRARDADLSHSSPRIPQGLRAPHRGSAAPADGGEPDL